MRKCSITIKDKDYTIRINRDSIVWLEQNGFNMADFDVKPLLTIELLWVAGFRMNHPEISRSDALELMEEYKEEGGDIMEVAKFVAEEYSSFMSALSVTKSKKKATIAEI